MIILLVNDFLWLEEDKTIYKSSNDPPLLHQEILRLFLQVTKKVKQSQMITQSDHFKHRRKGKYQRFAVCKYTVEISTSIYEWIGCFSSSTGKPQSIRPIQKRNII